MRAFALLAATAALIPPPVAGCGGKTAVGTAEQASRYIDDVLRGTKEVSAFRVADEAAPVARAAVADAQPLSQMQAVVDEAPQAACDFATIVSNVAKAAPDSVEPVTLAQDEYRQVLTDAAAAGVPPSVTGRVLNAALEMAQSTLVDAADKACNVAQNL